MGYIGCGRNCKCACASKSYSKRTLISSVVMLCIDFKSNISTHFVHSKYFFFINTFDLGNIFPSFKNCESLNSVINESPKIYVLYLQWYCIITIPCNVHQSTVKCKTCVKREFNGCQSYEVSVNDQMKIKLEGEVEEYWWVRGNRDIIAIFLWNKFLYVRLKVV